ncbi:CDP-diacylglycerol--serine O-phosphatidyltransferase [Rhodocytophaga rosea]|uniref:CDP-diacylglycerol--serine O-phosphatidyltransferase n=1 Tax=Rhodocytophaga rosea TaxID=2704465 RepID=A0A6C0GHT2_9BACT|nr:CDP-diacylglycerol--serine O-phosphatidyltransferase [Rhodocytophaga rosea]QHT67596.1 CDP-diacylglycerol--serine O-phosphatidyltransferase [Rhodocytophaga rosea]
MKKHIPNALTCGNLFCGCVGIVAALNNELMLAAYLTGIAAVLDFFDGFVARWLKAYSSIGKELDSLADCVTFGVLPGMIIFSLLRKSMGGEEYGLFEFVVVPYIAFVISIFSALRLAKFNVDTRQTSSFIGVPTPANAMLIASFPLILWQYPASSEIILNLYFLIGLTLVMSYLLVAEIPLFALKFDNYSFAANRTKYIFLILSLILIFALQFIAIPFIILLYIVLSLFTNRKAV